MSTLSWNMYGPGSEVAFRAAGDDQGYAITITRDGINLVTERAQDGASLFRRSLELRSSFQQLGYAATEARKDDAALRGGLCWGPSTPLPASLLSGCEIGRSTADSGCASLATDGESYEIDLSSVLRENTAPFAAARM